MRSRDTESVRLTLDRNCLIDVAEERRPYADAVFELMRYAKEGFVRISIPASSASERARPGKPQITNFSQFQSWVTDLGFEDVEFLAPILYLDYSFFDFAVFGGGEPQKLEERIHAVVAPNAAYQAPQAGDFEKWRNAKADVQAVWCHVYYETDALCTRDSKLIRRASRIPGLVAHVTTPSEVVAQVRAASSVA